MKTFYEWLEDASQQFQQGPPITQGQEANYARRNLINMPIDPEAFKEVFASGYWHSKTHGQSGMQDFYNKIKMPLNNEVLKKYMDDAARLTSLKRVWDGSMPRSVVQYDNGWANTTFKGNDSGYELDDSDDSGMVHPAIGRVRNVIDAGQEALGNIANITRGATQKSVFSRG